MSEIWNKSLDYKQEAMRLRQLATKQTDSTATAVLQDCARKFESAAILLSHHHLQITP